ncbi:MAG TPA: DsbA family protein [Acidimicrobiales bacterium]
MTDDQDRTPPASAGPSGAGVPEGGVDVHIDLMCPWAYQASLWLRDVRGQTGLELAWRWFSLEEVNRADGKKHPWERPWSWGWSLLRIGAWVRRHRGEAAVDAWCAAAGRALHDEGRKVHTPDVARRVLAEAGLDPAAATEAIDDPSTHDEVRADHERVRALGGFGVPTLIFPGERALFGPVVRQAPTGPAALHLWDLVCGWLDVPGLYEIRRPKTDADWAAIGDRFAPYLSARDWPTIQREVL